jgi:SAM-dependent methyltransferase
MKHQNSIPLPPAHLQARVGSLPNGVDPEEAYIELGLAVSQILEAILPSDWSWDRKKILDFGCGAGRTLRHFIPLANSAEFWGADLDPRSIAWNKKHLSPPFNFI